MPQDELAGDAAACPGQVRTLVALEQAAERYEVNGDGLALTPVVLSAAGVLGGVGVDVMPAGRALPRVYVPLRYELAIDLPAPRRRKVYLCVGPTTSGTRPPHPMQATSAGA